MPAGSPVLTRRLSGIRRAVRPCRLGAPVAQLFSQVMSGTGLAFSIPASSIPHRKIGIDRECRTPS
jgi:hypothetical protein